MEKARNPVPIQWIEILSRSTGTVYSGKTMNKSAKYHQLYMDIAKRVAQMSYDRDTQVGAVIVKNGNILSMGFNGMPTGLPNDCKDSEGKTLPEVIHAEQNAIYKLARDNGNALGATIYVTHAPCVKCCTAILMSGISTIIYDIPRYDSGLRILQDQVNVIKFREIIQ